MKNGYTIGIDMGVNNIGWSILDNEKEIDLVKKAGYIIEENKEYIKEVVEEFPKVSNLDNKLVFSKLI